MITKKEIHVTGMILGAFALVLLLTWGPHISYQTSEVWVCPISGATKTSTAWFGNMFRREERTYTALERWIVARDSTFEPQWQKISTSKRYLLGGRSFACSPAPEIYNLSQILEPFLQPSNELRVAALMVTLRKGSREEQRQMLQAICDEILQAP